MDFQAAVDALRALAGQQVIVVVQTPEWHPGIRPYRGRWSYEPDASVGEMAVFRVHEPHDPRWTNPDGVQVIINRAAFSDAERCGGPGELGVSIVQEKTRVSIYPTGPSP